MEFLDIKKYPNRVLRKKCALVDEITDRERTIFENMLFTMKYFEGIGLAAPQIGISKSLIVVDVGEGAIQLANPVILKMKGMDHLQEGCLSLPRVAVDIERPTDIIVQGLNEKGQFVEINVKGLMARVLQHEIDHLHGKLIIDYLSPLEKVKLKMHRFNPVKRRTKTKS